MSSTDVAGEGGKTPLPPMPEFRYVARVGDANSPAFETRDEAREWVKSQKEVSGNTGNSLIDMIEV